MGKSPRSKAGPGKIISVEKRTAALDLRRKGLGYQAIGDRLGISMQAAHTHVMNALADLNGILKEKTEEIRRIELERLDKLLESIWDEAVGGSLPALDRVLKISERRAKLMGIDGPAITGQVENAQGVTIYFPIEREE